MRTHTNGPLAAAGHLLFRWSDKDPHRNQPQKKNNNDKNSSPEKHSHLFNRNIFLCQTRYHFLKMKKAATTMKKKPTR